MSTIEALNNWITRVIRFLIDPSKVWVPLAKGLELPKGLKALQALAGIVRNYEGI